LSDDSHDRENFKFLSNVDSLGTTKGAHDDPEYSDLQKPAGPRQGTPKRDGGNPVGKLPPYRVRTFISQWLWTGGVGHGTPLAAVG
jgi:hypothetical protein